LADAAGSHLVVAVGHEPDLSELVAWAVGASSSAGVELKKASACRVSLPGAGEPCGQLHWLLPPRLLRCLGDES
jgi:phosphohistidine phosphatase SixA